MQIKQLVFGKKIFLLLRIAIDNCVVTTKQIKMKVIKKKQKYIHYDAWAPNSAHNIALYRYVSLVRQPYVETLRKYVVLG